MVMLATSYLTNTFSYYQVPEAKKIHERAEKIHTNEEYAAIDYEKINQDLMSCYRNYIKENFS